MKRVCIVQVTDKALPLIEKALPPNVKIAARREAFEYAGWELRLEGDGLPDYCDAPAEGDYYMRAVACVDSYGMLQFSPGRGIPWEQGR